MPAVMGAAAGRCGRGPGSYEPGPRGVPRCGAARTVSRSPAGTVPAPARSTPVAPYPFRRAVPGPGTARRCLPANPPVYPGADRENAEQEEKAGKHPGAGRIPWNPSGARV
ncbi:hypothetical protein GCM10023079_41760 [Streptomyces chitinivorans]